MPDEEYIILNQRRPGCLFFKLHRHGGPTRIIRRWMEERRTVGSFCGAVPLLLSLRSRTNDVFGGERENYQCMVNQP